MKDLEKRKVVKIIKEAIEVCKNAKWIEPEHIAGHIFGELMDAGYFNFEKMWKKLKKMITEQSKIYKEAEAILNLIDQLEIMAKKNKL